MESILAGIFLSLFVILIGFFIGLFWDRHQIMKDRKRILKENNAAFKEWQDSNRELRSLISKRNKI